MAIHFSGFGPAWSNLGFGGKLRLALSALAGLLVLAVVLSLSAALFLVLAPILLVSGIVGGYLMRRRMRAAAEAGAPYPQDPAGGRTIDAQYIVIEPGRGETDSRRRG